MTAPAANTFRLLEPNPLNRLLRALIRHRASLGLCPFILHVSVTIGRGGGERYRINMVFFNQFSRLFNAQYPKCSISVTSEQLLGSDPTPCAHPTDRHLSADDVGVHLLFNDPHVPQRPARCQQRHPSQSQLNRPRFRGHFDLRHYAPPSIGTGTCRPCPPTPRTCLPCRTPAVVAGNREGTSIRMTDQASGSGTPDRGRVREISKRSATRASFESMCQKGTTPHCLTQHTNFPRVFGN